MDNSIIPKNWLIKKLKDIAFCNTGVPAPQEAFLLPSEAEKGVNFLRISDLSNNDNNSIENTKDKVKEGSFFKKFKAGTIVFPKSGESIRTNVRAILSKDMYVVSHLACVYARKNVNNKFIFYILKNENFENLINQTALPALSLYDIKNLEIILPNLIEQNKIVSYLDIETDKIDKKISILEQKIEKLGEYKQSVIFETVTKGLDKNVEMKDSGIEWIGQIPKHWEIKRIKDVSKIKKGKAIETFLEKNEEMLPCIDTNYLRGRENIVFAKKGTKIYSDKVLILWDGANAGELFFNKNEGYLGSTFGCFNTKMNNKFFFYYLKGIEQHSRDNLTGMGIPHVDGNVLKQMISIIPTKKEQEEIANFLDDFSSKIDNKVKLIKKKIELLKEYKEAIIYEAVTGKMEIL